MSDKERRKLPRKYLVIYSRVFDRKSGQVIGYLSDLTAEGCMLIGESLIAQDTLIDIRVDLPDDPPFTRKQLDLTARAMWSRPDIDPSFYNTGFHFENPTAEDIALIEEMIEAYEFRRDTPQYPPSVSELENPL